MSAVARLALSRRRVAVAYADAAGDGTYTVRVTTGDRALRSFTRPRAVAATAGDGSDRFLPTVAFDRATGDLWACFYDTRGDSTRRHAWYTCTVSADDGRTWAQPVHAASAKSNEAQTAAGVAGYGDVEGLVAADGVAHPVWTDSRNALGKGEEIYTAAIPAGRLRTR